MNKKGFSLVELLAVITILGILSTAAVMAVTKYLAKSKMADYEAIETSLYDAAKSYLLNSVTIENQTITARALINHGYLETLSDPVKKGSSCDLDKSNVIIINNGSTDTNLDDITYKVTISCSAYQTTVNFPK